MRRMRYHTAEREGGEESRCFRGGDWSEEGDISLFLDDICDCCDGSVVRRTSTTLEGSCVVIRSISQGQAKYWPRFCFDREQEETRTSPSHGQPQVTGPLPP